MPIKTSEEGGKALKNAALPPSSVLEGIGMTRRIKRDNNRIYYFDRGLFLSIIRINFQNEFRHFLLLLVICPSPFISFGCGQFAERIDWSTLKMLNVGTFGL